MTPTRRVPRRVSAAASACAASCPDAHRMSLEYQKRPHHRPRLGDSHPDRALVVSIMPLVWAYVVCSPHTGPAPALASAPSEVRLSLSGGESIDLRRERSEVRQPDRPSGRWPPPMRSTASAPCPNPHCCRPATRSARAAPVQADPSGLATTGHFVEVRELVSVDATAATTTDHAHSTPAAHRFARRSLRSQRASAIPEKTREGQHPDDVADSPGRRPIRCAP